MAQKKFQEFEDFSECVTKCKHQHKLGLLKSFVFCYKYSNIKEGFRKIQKIKSNWGMIKVQFKIIIIGVVKAPS